MSLGKQKETIKKEYKHTIKGVKYIRRNKKEQQLTKESNSFPAIQQPMVIRERDNHNGPDDDLAVHDDRFLFDGMHAYCKAWSIYGRGKTRQTAHLGRRLGAN